MVVADPEIASARDRIKLAEHIVSRFEAKLEPLEKSQADFEASFATRRVQLRITDDVDGIKALETQRRELRHDVSTLKEDLESAKGELGEARLALRRLENAEQVNRDCRKMRKYGAAVRDFGEIIEKELAPRWKKLWGLREEIEATWPGGTSMTFGKPPHVDYALVRPDDLIAAVAAALYRSMGKQFIGGAHPEWSEDKTYYKNNEVVHRGMIYACLGAGEKGEEPVKGLVPSGGGNQHWRSTGISRSPAQAPTFPGASPRNILQRDPKQSWSLEQAANHAVAYLISQIEGTPWNSPNINQVTEHSQ